jgi:hypothetical protein
MAGAVVTRQVATKGPTLEGLEIIVPVGGEGKLNDASCLSETPIYKHIVLSDDPGEGLLATLRNELREAAAEKRPVNISAARHSMVGYGLIGIITELEIEAVPAAVSEPKSERMRAEEFAVTFENTAHNVPMAYGKLNVDREDFFREALLLSYRTIEGEIPESSTPGVVPSLSQKIFRAQVNNEAAKRRRWGLETGVGPLLAGPISRSGLMNVSTSTLLK